jgi:hypothetical protein
MDRSVNSEDIAETFGIRLYLKLINPFVKNRDIPYMISIVYEGYSSSLNFEIKGVGKEAETKYSTILGEPMTLRRF